MKYSINSVSNRRRKKRTHYSGMFFVGIAFLAFIVIGLTVSLSIRACSHHKNYAQEVIQHTEPSKVSVNTNNENIPEVSLPYEMLDSVIRICVPRPWRAYQAGGKITGYRFFHYLEDSVKRHIYDMDNITVTQKNAYLSVLQ